MLTSGRTFCFCSQAIKFSPHSWSALQIPWAIMTWPWTPNAPASRKTQETTLHHESRGYLNALWKIEKIFSVLCEKISKGMLFVSWVLLQLHMACVVQGFKVMPLDRVPGEGILFQTEFQIFTPSGKLHVCSRNLSFTHPSLWHIQKFPRIICAKLLCLPSQPSCRRTGSSHLSKPCLWLLLSPVMAAES